MLRFKHLFKNKREFTLWGIALALFVFTLGYGIFTIKFAAGKLNSALTSKLQNPPSIATFNLEKLDELLQEKGKALEGQLGTTTPKQ
jgi:hypothetical protein